MDDEENQQDLFQKITYQAWKSFSKFRGENLFSTWLYRIAFVPFSIAEIFFIFELIPNFKTMTGLTFIFSFLVFYILMLGTLYILGKCWLTKFYGKYFSQISKLIDDLK